MTGQGKTAPLRTLQQPFPPVPPKVCASDYVAGGWLSCGLVLVELLLPPAVWLAFFLGSCLAYAVSAPPSLAAKPLGLVCCCCHPVRAPAARPLALVCCCCCPAWALAPRGVLLASFPPPGFHFLQTLCPCPAWHWLGQRFPSPPHRVGHLCLRFALAPPHSPHRVALRLPQPWSARLCPPVSFSPPLLFSHAVWCWLSPLCSTLRFSRGGCSRLVSPSWLQLPSDATGFGKGLWIACGKRIMYGRRRGGTCLRS